MIWSYIFQYGEPPGSIVYELRPPLAARLLISGGLVVTILSVLLALGHRLLGHNPQVESGPLRTQALDNCDVNEQQNMSTGSELGSGAIEPFRGINPRSGSSTQFNLLWRDLALDFAP